MRPFKVVFISILLVLIYAPLATAAPSLLAMCHKDWNCNATVKMYRGHETLKLSWLTNTFGTECQCPKRLIADSRPKVVRVHLSNGPCLRNRRCGRYEAFYGHTPASASRAVLRNDKKLMGYFDKQLNDLAVMFSSSTNLTCYVSPCLECDLNESARRVLLHRVSVALPQCVPVDSPHRQRCAKGYVCEFHGESPNLSKPCIADMDGTDGRTIDVKKWVDRYAKCDLAYYWEPWMNCIRGEFVDPRRRDCKYGSATFMRTRRILCRYFLLPLFGTC
jgi:hypothetical protein